MSRLERGEASTAPGQFHSGTGGAASVGWRRALVSVVLPYVLLVTASAFWGGNVVAGRALAMPGPDQISPAVLNALRWGIALLAFLPFVSAALYANWAIIVAHSPRMLALGSLGMAGYYLLFYGAVRSVPAVEAGLLVGAMPAVIVVMATLVRSEQIIDLRLLGLAVSLAGSLLAVLSHDGHGFGSSSRAGEIMIGAAVLCWSAYTVLLQRWSIPVPTLVLTFGTAFFGFLVSLAAAGLEVVTHAATLHLTGTDLALVFYIGLFPAAGATLCWNAAVRRLGSSTPAAFLTLIPVFSMAFTAAFLGERVGPIDFASLVLVVGGVALVVLRPAPAPSDPAAPSRAREAATFGRWRSDGHADLTCKRSDAVVVEALLVSSVRVQDGLEPTREHVARG